MEDNSQTVFFFFFSFLIPARLMKGIFCFHVDKCTLCKFTIIFLKSSMNHEIAILNDICTNIFKLVVRYILFPKSSMSVFFFTF